MISFLRGRLASRGLGWAEIDVAGIGFRVAVSAHGASALPGPGENVTLPTVLVVREEALGLYGFCDEEERSAFSALTAVAGIGPKIALAVLSALTPAGLARAVEAEDLGALTAISGVGRKTAQRLVLELKGQLPGASGPPPPAQGPEADARAALIALGYGATEAGAALEQLRGEVQDSGALVRGALRLLGTRR